LRATAAAVIALPITIPPTGTRKRGSGSMTPSATTRPRVLAAATDSDPSSGQKTSGTRRARCRAVKAPKITITASSATTRPMSSSSKMMSIT
jgi:hypothetical protein